jgi:hypothetical protein
VSEIEHPRNTFRPTAGEIGLHRQEPGTATPESAGPSLNVPRTQAPPKPYVKPVVSHGRGDPLAGLSGDPMRPVEPGEARQTAGLTDQETRRHPSEEDRLREEIAQTREDLGRTVEALAGKADVKARARRKMTEARSRLTTTGGAARRKVAERSGTARLRAAEVAERLRGTPATTHRHLGDGGADATLYDRAGGAADRVLAQAARHPMVLIAAGAVTMAAAGWSTWAGRRVPVSRRRSSARGVRRLPRA